MAFRTYGLIFFLLALSFPSFAQKYKVTYSGGYINSDCCGGYNQIVPIISNSSEGQQLIGDGVTYFNQKPTKFYFFAGWAITDSQADVLDQCNYTSPTYPLTLNDCDYFENYLQGCNISGNLSFTIEPILQSPTGSPSGVYCFDQGIVLNGTSGFSSTTYIWQYSTNASNGFVTLRTTNSNTTTIYFSDLGGASLNQNIYFRYTIGSCSSLWSPPTTAYTFTPPQVSGTYSGLAPTCQGGSDGSINVLSYSRSPISGESFWYEIHSSADINPGSLENNGSLSAGTHQVVTRSTYGCGSLIFTPVVVPPGPRTGLSASVVVSSSYNGSQLSCSGSSDGQLTVSTNGGGNGSYTYSLDGSPSYQSSNVFTGVSAGSHVVTVKDGCSTPTTANTNSTTITAPSSVVISSLTPSLCNGSNNGVISVSAGGGTGSLSYSRDGSTFQSSNVFSGLSPGSYTITVRDANNCSASGSVTVPFPVNAGTVNVTHPTCSGSNTGTITVSGSGGGTGSLSYSRDGSTFQSSPTFIGVPSGTYTITVKDVNGCTATQSATVNSPVSASYSSTVASCATVSDGSITVTGATGGTGSYTYSLDGSNYQSSNVFTGKGSGSYTIYVKDGNGCVYTISNATIGQQPSVTGAITQTSFINCFGQSTASFNVVASGGTSPYGSYSWSNGSSGTSVSNVGAGTYTVTITDSKGCQGTQSITVTQPSQLNGTLSPSIYNGYNISCKGGNNGTVSVTPTGGTSPYSYAWNTGAITPNINTLPAGNYSVTITDSKSCTTSKNITLTEPVAAVTVVQQSKSDVTCFGSSNGMITVNGTGGVGALNYSKDGSTYQLSTTFTSLGAGTYTITAKDANGCTATTPGIVITTPTALSISGITKVNPVCNGSGSGSLQVTATGGTTPYQYSLDGTNYVTSASFSSLAAGSYVVTVKDGNGCIVSSTAQVLSDPLVITASTSTTSQSCSTNTDGTITVTASGGTGALSYSLNGSTYQSGNVFTSLSSGSYTVTIKDGNGCTKTTSATVGLVATLTGTITQTSFINCNGQTTGALTVGVSGGTSPYSYTWSTGAHTQSVSSLGAGSYSVTVTDSKNCSTSKSASVTEPSVLTVSKTSSDYNGYGVTCATTSDGFVNLTVSGGTSPYSYAWSNGSITKNISGLPSGTYTVTVTDSKSCTGTQSQTLTAPAALSQSTGKANISCNGGSDGVITVNGTGGAGGYTYSINGGSSWQTGTMFSTLTAGSYTIQTKDQNSCTSSASVTLTQPAAISITIGTIQNAGCGQTNGSIQSSATGGTGALNYEWRNASNQVVGTSSNLVNAGSGTYTLTVTDQNSCSQTTTAGVSNPSGPVFSIINQVSTTCSNTSDGKATVNITSGTGPYVISWGDGETGVTATQLPGGSNTVTVKDGNNCSTTQSMTVVSPQALALSNVQNHSPSCPSGSDGSIQVTVAGGTSPYSYAWNGNGGSSTLTGLAAGSYSLKVTDAKSCELNQSINVTDVPVITIATVNEVMPTCSTSTDGSVVVQASGGNGGYSYSWNTGVNGAQLNSVGGGDYTVTVKDSKNCSQAKTITVTSPQAVTSTVSATGAACYGSNDGQLQVTASGGTGSYSYSRDNGNTWQSSSTFTNLGAGNYTIRTKDQNGCSTSQQSTVTEPAQITLTTTKTDPTCNQPNGTAQVTVTGGTGAYSYEWKNSTNQIPSVTDILQQALPDSYTVQVQDANQCIATKTVTLNTYADAQFTVENIGSTTCSNTSDGSATVQVTSVQGPYAIRWTSGETTGAATQLGAGTNGVTLTDKNNCTVTKNFMVPSPVALSVLTETMINPTCAGGSDGAIQVTVTGGTGVYTYTWNGSTGTNAIQNQKAGTYALIVKDNNNCTFTKSYTLTDPTPFTINLGSDKEICPNTTVEIGLTLPNATYAWTGPGGFANTAGIVSVGEAGTYELQVVNEKGCQAKDQIGIIVKKNLLKTDFLMVSKGEVGDTIVMIDISWPLPDQIEWQWSDSVEVIEKEKDYALIRFTEPGTYTLGVKASLGGCEDEYYQQIEIEKRRGSEAHGGGKGDGDGSRVTVSKLESYPNPFEGKTHAQIELSGVGNATLKIYSLSTNRLVLSHEFEGDQSYQAELDLGTREAGLYILVLETNSHTKALRIIKL
jgi:hypothetical protein